MKSSKRPSDSNSVTESFSKVRKQEQDGHDTDEEDGSTSLYPQTMDINSESSSYHQESSMEISQSDGIASSRIDHTQLPSSPLAENILEVEVDFNEKVGKRSQNLPNTGIPDVLNAEFALRNTNGGVIKLKMKTSLSPKTRMKKIDKWQLNLNRERENRLKRMGQKEDLAEIVDYKIEDLMIFVKKSSIILTEQSNLYMRRGTERYSPQNFFEIQNVFQNNVKPHCCCTNGPPEMSYALDKEMLFGESTTVEYKHLSTKSLPDKLRKKLKDYIAQFANTRGGDVYFGITDNAIIKGQHVDDKEAIKYKIEQCMESKIWISKCGKKDTPENGKHYKVNFSHVNGADEQTFVIRVHICQYAGIVFHKDSEPEAKLIDDNNQISKMSFKRWLSTFLNTVRINKGNSDYRDRFKKRTCGTSTYYSLKETVETFVNDLTSGQLKLHPSHATKWIRHPALDTFVENVEKTFQEKRWYSGIAYIERSWEVNLGLPSTKPDNVICDILLCCPEMPVVFVSLTSHTPDETSHAYNRKVAAALKAKLVQDAHCLEKFYVKNVVISHQHLEDGDESWSPYSESHLYPETYRMSNDKYLNILEALVLILARTNGMSSHTFGQGLFNLLTHEQYNLLHEFYENSRKVKITGPPGSGKTVLALERIHRLRNEGCSYDEVLFLCSNKPLKARVKNMKTNNGQPLCIVKTYYDIGLYGGFGDLDSIKHILADEAQNFHEGDTSLKWWYSLLHLCDNIEDSSFWVFFDIDQKINNKRSVSLREFPKKELKIVIRQTRNVHSFITSKYMQLDRGVKLGHDFDGPKVDILVPSESNAVGQVQSHQDKTKHLMYILIFQLHKLIEKEGYPVNDITVLFNNREEKESYQRIFEQQTNKTCPVKNGEEVKKDGVVFDTIRRYCGVDDNIIIGFCPKFYSPDFQNYCALMTSLCSRTKLKLILIFESENNAECFDLVPTELIKVKFGNMKKVSDFSKQ